VYLYDVPLSVHLYSLHLPLTFRVVFDRSVLFYFFKIIIYFVMIYFITFLRKFVLLLNKIQTQLIILYI
jgi:hypothetical protein